MAGCRWTAAVQCGVAAHTIAIIRPGNAVLFDPRQWRVGRAVGLQAESFAFAGFEGNAMAPSTPTRKPPAEKPAPARETPERGTAHVARILLRGFAAIHAVLALIFMLASLVLIAITVKSGWDVLSGGLDEAAALDVIQMIGIAAVAVVALQIAQTIAEEEVIREAHVSGPTRVRRFLSRFMVVIVVSLAVEGLIATFKALREDPSQLPYAASLLVAVGFLMAGWGAFVWLNRAAEELEPEAMALAKSEDEKLE